MTVKQFAKKYGINKTSVRCRSCKQDIPMTQTLLQDGWAWISGEPEGHGCGPTYHLASGREIDPNSEFNQAIKTYFARANQ